MNDGNRYVIHNGWTLTTLTVFSNSKPQALVSERVVPFALYSLCIDILTCFKEIQRPTHIALSTFRYCPTLFDQQLKDKERFIFHPLWEAWAKKLALLAWGFYLTTTIYWQHILSSLSTQNTSKICIHLGTQTQLQHGAWKSAHFFSFDVIDPTLMTEGTSALCPVTWVQMIDIV